MTDDDLKEVRVRTPLHCSLRPRAALLFSLNPQDSALDRFADEKIHERRARDQHLFGAFEATVVPHFHSVTDTVRVGGVAVERKRALYHCRVDFDLFL